jgi:glutamate--cysteine ligase
MNLPDRISSFAFSRTVAPGDRRVGIEIENLLYTEDLNRLRVNPEKGYSATDLLKEILKYSADDEDYSLEPGGQLEWASPPHSNLHELAKAFHTHQERLDKISQNRRLKTLCFGIDPTHEPEEIDLIHQTKYQLMDRHLEKVGTLGRWMMRNSSSIQMNFDIVDEKDAGEILFISDALQPVAAYLFANSPFWKRECAGDRNLRYEIWEATDPKRCRNLIDQGLSQLKNIVPGFIDYIQTVPGIFQLDESGQPEETKGTLGDRLMRLEQEGALNDMHIQGALRQIFTNVRLKSFVEVRGADRTPAGFEMAPVAFWTGLLTSEETREKVLEEVVTWSVEERHAWNKAAFRLDSTQKGLKGKNYGEWNCWAAGLALEGLKTRGLGEESLLEPFFAAARIPFALQTQTKFKESGKTLSDFLSKQA